MQTRHRPRTISTIAPILVATALVLAACGGDTTEDATVEDATADAAPPSTAPPTSEVVMESTVASTTVASTTDTAASGGFSMMDFRYCEILLTVDDGDGGEVTGVWGTPGVDPCTDDAWYALDPDAIRVEAGASFVDMNGPRYFVVDGAVDTANGAGGTGTAAGGEEVTRRFGDITMALVATAEVTAESEPYAADLVARTTTWAYRAGTEVYELIDPDGNVYLMQSYSQIVDRSVTVDDLPTLGDRLDLPEGWSYRSRVLDEPLQVALSPDGAIVIQDDLRNAYQRNG